MENKEVSLEEATTESTVEDTNLDSKPQEEAPKTDASSEKKENKILSFFITTLNGMAYGLFATLIVGTIIATIGNFFKDGAATNEFCKFVYQMISGKYSAGEDVAHATTYYGAAVILQNLTGFGIGVGVAIALKKKPLEVVVLGAVGELTALFSLSTKFVTSGAISNGAAFQIGDPLTIYLTVISVALLMKLVLRKKTPVDILIIPLFAIATGLAIGLLVRFPAIYVTFGVQWLVNVSTNAVPFVMGIVVAVLMGMALTAPISSAAIAAMVFTLPEGVTIAAALADPNYSGLVIASGAACIGCCCQMVGFAVQSRRDNSVGMVVSIGIGTSMLQFKNILKKPIVWLPTIIASAILGPIVTCAFKIYCVGSNAGMGTSGLVGQIGTLASMGNGWQTWLGIFGFEIILPAALVFGIDFLFYKLGWIKKGDLTV